MAGLTLYQLSAEMAEIRDILIENGGELTSELEERMTMNEEALRNKAASYHALIRQFDDTSDAIAKEIKRLQALKKTADNSSARLKERIFSCMTTYGMEAVDGGTVKYSLKKCPVSTEVDTEAMTAALSAKMAQAQLMMPEYVKLSASIDKTVLKDMYYKKGEDIVAPSWVAFVEDKKTLAIK